VKLDKWLKPVNEAIAKHWRGILARLPLPMLAIPASYGVYEFTALFVPVWVAIIQAAAFETVYVGLAAYDNLSKADKGRALAISGFAVVASVAYNTLAGMFRLDDNLLRVWKQDIWGVTILSALHGVPLALLAFLVSNFTLHGSTKQEEPQPQEEPRPQSRNLLEVVENHGQTLPTVAVEKSEPAPQEEAEKVPEEDIEVLSLVEFDPRLIAPPKGLATDLKEAVLLYATHKSYPQAAKYSKYSRETIRTRVAEARKVVPRWVATVLQEQTTDK